jgi:hypothetical protein
MTAKPRESSFVAESMHLQRQDANQLNDRIEKPNAIPNASKST